MANEGNYTWKYCSVGGVVRVKIDSGEDIAHLGELDKKMWTVLSCPTSGLQFDGKTLSLLDTDGDGRIRVDEVVAAAKWLTSIIKDKDSILKGDSVLKLDNINVDNETGAKLHASAKQILANLGLDKDEISIDEASDSVAIFSGTPLNGDGVITPASTDDEELKKLIADCAEKIGAATDRSGEAGVTAESIEAFYAACADYADWMKAGKPDDKTVFPYGENTEAALAACNAIKEKVADYFMRCKLIGFDADVAGAVDVSVDKVGAISALNLATQTEEIASCPLARPTADAALPFDGINPAWKGAFDAVKTLVLDVDFAGKKSITEAEWNSVLAKFGAYTAWKDGKKGAAVESLGLEAVEAILKADRKQALLDIVAADKALEAESNSIDEVCRLLHYYRDFAALLRNYVIFSDFYGRSKGTRGIFEAGRLFIDQRCCDLCIKVEDMGKHADMAGLSGMFLIYCNCTSKTLGKTMTIAAVMTDGGVKNLRPGKNAIFYDLDGQDWDAVVTKVIDNPISIKDAFWSPYRKLANTITERINKSATEKESKVNGNMVNAANSVNVPASKDEAKAAGAAAVPAQPFDIAKFAGIFAAIGMALGMIGSAIMKIINPWYNVIVLLIVLVVCISGPSMFLAWQKLRKRNLGPVLNANGWAINSVVLVNILFGRTLTSVARYPKMKLSDPFAKKGTPAWIKWLIGIIIVACAFAALYFTDNLKCIGLERKAKVEEVQVEAAVEQEAAPAEAETAVIDSTEVE